MDHETFQEWLQMEFDGELEEAKRPALASHLESCASCRSEQAELESLRTALAQGAVKVRPDFASAVMSALPPAGWESRHARTWAFPLALVGALGGAAAILAGVSAAQLHPAGAAGGAFGALLEMFSAAALAGAGLLQASWRGVGLALSGVLSGSWVNFGAFALGVAGLNLLVYRLVRRGRREPSAEHARRR